MPVTMMDMKLVFADKLFSDQLMVGDLIQVDGEIIEVISITCDKTGDNYTVETKDEFGDTESHVFNYMDFIPLYVFIDEE